MVVLSIVIGILFVVSIFVIYKIVKGDSAELYQVKIIEEKDKDTR